MKGYEFDVISPLYAFCTACLDIYSFLLWPCQCHGLLGFSSRTWIVSTPVRYSRYINPRVSCSYQLSATPYWITEWLATIDTKSLCKCTFTPAQPFYTFHYPFFRLCVSISLWYFFFNFTVILVNLSPLTLDAQVSGKKYLFVPPKSGVDRLCANMRVAIRFWFYCGVWLLVVELVGWLVEEMLPSDLRRSPERVSAYCIVVLLDFLITGLPFSCFWLLSQRNGGRNVSRFTPIYNNWTHYAFAADA